LPYSRRAEDFSALPCFVYSYMMKKILWRSVALACCCLLLSACATARPRAHEGGKVIAGVPFYPQEDYQCGPASLAGVLNYLGLETAPDKIAQDIFSKSAGGTLTIDMVLYAQEKGFSAMDYSGSIKDLRDNINAGSPVIVMVDNGFWVWQKNHFMVVVGYNDNGIVANSGGNERQFIANDRFLHIWGRTGFWSLLIKKK
jgi:ABC-type bacteriocin/lantibiotic exporter with double-glycine peptidase domain